MRVPCWTLYRSVSERASPAARMRTAIENALFRIALPHLDPLGLGSFLHHDVDFLSPADVRDVHRDLRAAVERNVGGPVRTHLDRGLCEQDHLHEILDERVGVLHHRFRGAGGDDPTIVQDDHPPREHERLFLIVGDEQGRHFLPSDDRSDFLHDLGAHRRVERAERLVQEEDPGTHAQRAGEGDPLPLATRELARKSILFSLQMNEVEHLRDPLLRDVSRDPSGVQSVADVVRHGEVRKEGEALVDDPDSAALRRQLADLLAIDEDLPRLGRQFPQDASKEGGLSAARGTQNRGQLAVLKSEGHILQNRLAVDGFREPSDLEGGHSNGPQGGGGRNTCGVRPGNVVRGAPVSKEPETRRVMVLNPRAIVLPPPMTFSQAQAARVRKALAGRKEITEKEMFGGIAFLLGGNMCVGVHGDDLIVRIEPSTTEAMLKEPGAKPFDLAGARAMAGWLLVAPAGYRTETTLRTWVARGVGFASSLPKKQPGRKR